MTKSKSQRQDFWRSHLQEWEKSGATQVDYCRQHGISVKSFGYQKRVRANKRGTGQLCLVPHVKSTQVVDKDQVIRIWCGDFRLEVGKGFDQDTFLQVITTLRSL